MYVILYISYLGRFAVFKKSLILVMLFLSGCSTSVKDKDYWCQTCWQQIDGLSCTKEQVFVPSDIVGNPVHTEDTWFWFDDLEKCNNFVEDKKNKKLINSKGYMPAVNCGIVRENGYVLGAETFYIYSDGKGDGENYYLVEDDFSASINFKDKDTISHPVEKYKILLTSESALEIMKKDAAKNCYCSVKAKKIKIKRQY